MSIRRTWRRCQVPACGSERAGAAPPRPTSFGRFAPGAAEQNLIAANAQIEVARAAYFPRLSLSGFLGGQSTQLSSLFSGAHSAWNLTPEVTQPIFTAGRIKSSVRLAEAEKERVLVNYQKTIQTAFTEVSNGLIAHQ